MDATAALGACARIAHDPVAIMFTIGIGRDTADNVLATGQFVVNIPAFAPDELRALCLTGTAGEQRAGSRRTDRDGRPRREAAAHRRVQPPL